jgi:hypothetical protein
MHRFLLPAIIAFVIACSPAGSSTASAAEAWGCSYEKCLSVCSKAGGKNCSHYCSNKLVEKQKSKVCK